MCCLCSRRLLWLRERYERRFKSDGGSGDLLQLDFGGDAASECWMLLPVFGHQQ